MKIGETYIIWKDSPYFKSKVLKECFPREHCVTNMEILVEPIVVIGIDDGDFVSFKEVGKEKEYILEKYPFERIYINEK